MKEKKKIIYFLLLLGANLIILLTLWLHFTYDAIRLDQFLYQLKSSAAGADPSLSIGMSIFVGGIGILLTLFEIFIYHRFGSKNPSLLKRRGMIAISLLIAGVVLFGLRLDVLNYINKQATDSRFIENNYVDASEVNLTFPEKKRNLIYIYLESLENTYANEALGDNYIEELTNLASENINFSNTLGLGGALSFTGTTWTAASMVSQTSGVPVKVPLLNFDFNDGKFLPGVTTLGDVLANEGYNQTLLIGSDKEFANRDVYFETHGNYEIIDINTLKEEGRLPLDYHEFWGFEDHKLFEFAKEELTRISSEDEPFNFTLLTADTHFPDGYVCELCPDTYENSYANVLACSSHQVVEFVNWIKEQDFYENTTIVISGDHLTMDPKFLSDLDEAYVRTIYNTIINTAIKPVREKNRYFGVFDMFPTTLASLGVEIEGNRLGLGTNLFSDEKTLTEKYGYEFLEEELQLASEYYDKELLGI